MGYEYICRALYFAIDISKVNRTDGINLFTVQDLTFRVS